MKAGTYCTAIFFNVSQAFDKVCHQELLHKIKNSFLTNLYAIIKSYLLYRTFRVKYGEVVTQLKEINFEVPQSSVLEPVSVIYCRSFDRSGLHNSLCRHSRACSS